MTRKKVKLAFIVNDSARKATFKKRKKGLMKKVSELSTLCGIDACAIVYSPYDPQPEVWPSPMGVQRVLAKFRRMPELEQSKKMVLTKNAQSQTQVAAPAVTDAVSKIEDKGQGSHSGQGFDINMDLMQKQNWFMNLMNNGGGGNETMPFGDVNQQNGFWPNPFFH
ncbi:MADS-box transcription enhancer factor 2A [Vigna unguiculata]|uniref:MADS-box transcription enhancer factor 2A n=1 Tax=Vigna unguiculata TaxID=3917 RepID=A0A4D6MAM1_VIGUN|nr:MADS-box transcription enhancer factor 2A [Vigna unguiculata]